MTEPVKSRFKTLTEAERFCDRQIDRATELFGSPWTLNFNEDEKVFRLSFDHPRIASHEVSYEVDNLHVYVEEDAA